MQVTAKSRRIVRLQNILFVVLLLGIAGMLGWLSTRYNYQADWTSGARRTLSEASVKLLETLKGPVRITAFAQETSELRKPITELVGRYQRHKSDITLSFIDPAADPARARELGVNSNGEMLIEYQGRSEHLREPPAEQAMSNALQRLARGGERWLVFLDGHGERKATGPANHDVSDWVRQIEGKGFKTLSINLAQTPQIPDNTTVLVIANPRVDLLPGELKAIEDYVARGGNLLWLGEPEPLHGLQPLAAQLGVRFEPGTIVDPTTQLLAIDNAAIAVVGEYGAHPITRDFSIITVFPFAAALDYKAPPDWRGAPFLVTAERSWSERGALQGSVTYDQGIDIAGPLNVGVAMSRARPGGAEGAQQRVVVTGDGDFLANAYLGNAGNLDLGLRIVNWLSADEALIDVPAKTAPDRTLTLSPLQSGIISIGFFFVLPLALVVSGVWIWVRRRRR